MDIKRYSDPTTTALALAEEVFVRGTAEGIRPVHIAVSGGSTPRLLFELLASPSLRGRVRWERIQLYWVDERCVPPTDADSNYGMTLEALLRHVPLPEGQIHRIRGEAEPVAEAERYTALVREQLPQDEASGLPAFDYVLLGIGDDGHTSSIFPHEMARLLPERTPYVVGTHPSGQRRIALAGQTILSARRVIFHAVGAGKRTILDQIARRSPEAAHYPAAYFFAEREGVELYTDQDIFYP